MTSLNYDHIVIAILVAIVGLYVYRIKNIENEKMTQLGVLKNVPATNLLASNATNLNQPLPPSDSRNDTVLNNEIANKIVNTPAGPVSGHTAPQLAISNIPTNNPANPEPSDVIHMNNYICVRKDMLPKATPTHQLMKNYRWVKSHIAHIDDPIMRGYNYDIYYSNYAKPNMKGTYILDNGTKYAVPNNYALPMTIAQAAPSVKN